MINKIVLLFASVGWVFAELPPTLTNCQKKPSDFSKAILLREGNYWMYSNKTINLPDSSATESPEVTISIQQDTLINGEKYYKRVTNTSFIELVRDSSGYLIDEKGRVSFSSTNRKDTLYRHPGDGIGYMLEEEEEIQVGGKTFKTIAFVVLSQEKDKYGKNELLRKTWYANKVGMVRRHLYYKNTIYSLELKKYKVR